MFLPRFNRDGIYGLLSNGMKSIDDWAHAAELVGGAMKAGDGNRRQELRDWVIDTPSWRS
jgi:hypothetical protein